MTITPEEVVVGMYVHAFTGSWFHHPFWRARFVIEDDETLHRIRSSGVPSVVIDDSKGVSPQGSLQPATILPEARPDMPLPRIGRVPPQQSKRPQNPEIDRARATIARGKQMMMRLFDDARRGQLACSDAVMELVEDISESVERSRTTLINIVRLKTKDEYTYLHSVAVCALMVNFARHLGMDERQVRDLGVAGLFHDVGKMAVPLAILNNPGRLSDAEFAEIKGHTTAGHDLLAQCDTIPPVALDVAVHHHERMDGRGYPYGLSAGTLSLPARMGAICDIYDALTSDRAYKDAWSPADAIAKMDGWDGHLDPALLFAFMRSVGIYPTGILVRLRSNRLGVVLPNGRRGSRVKVRTFFCALDQVFLPQTDVVLGDSMTDDQVSSREDPSHWALDQWADLHADLMAGRYRPPPPDDQRVA